MLENITTEPHAHDISADIVRVWLSGYILQQSMYVCMYVCMYVYAHTRTCDVRTDIRRMFHPYVFTYTALRKHMA